MPRMESHAGASAYATVRQRHVEPEKSSALQASHGNLVISAESYLHHFFALCPDLLGVVSSQTHTWMRVNPAFTTMLGWAEKDLLGAWLFDLVHPEDRERCKIFEASLRNGQKFVSFEHRVVCKYGGHRWIAWHTSASASQALLFCVGRDVTLARCTLDSLRALNNRVQRTNEELEQFVNTAGHDLQEPLRTVSMYTELLMRRHGRELPAPAAELASTIAAANARMQQLLRDLLEYGRLSQGAEPALFETVSLEAVFEETLESLKSSLEESSASMTHDPLPEVHGNGTQLLRLLQNLFSNSIKYRRNDVPLHIHLGVKKHGSEWQFCVKDNGRGFSSENADRIFGAFKRLHGRDVPGTGLGLPICRRIIEYHGGRIWAEGKPDEGATFWFTLPDRPIA